MVRNCEPKCDVPFPSGRLGRTVLLMAICAFPALAQQFGEITGTTTDASGAVITGAAVAVTNTATQQARTVTSNDSGIYSVPYLVPGMYNVRVTKDGFKVSARAGVELHVGDVIRADFSLQLGDVSQQVEVTGAAQQLNTESSTLGTVIGSRQIVDLPLNGRDYLNLVTLSPNVTAEQTPGQITSFQGGTRGLTNITIAGQRIEYNHYTLDGVENTDPNFGSYIIHPSVDALQEFKIQTGVYSAEFGRGASQINVNTLSGTNAYHGAAFEFLRNDALDAKAWGQAGTKNPFHRNNYGFTLGGPISIPKLFDGRNRLFFMSNYENLRDVTVIQNRSSVAPDAMRGGNFSLTPGVQIIYDPASRKYPAGAPASSTPFPGNIIPAARIAPQAAILQSSTFYPSQSVPGFNASLLNNFIYNSPTVTEAFQVNERADWIENTNSTWFARYSQGDDSLNTGGAFFNSGTSVPTNVKQGVLENTRVLTPRIVNEARFAWNEFDNFIANYYANKTNVQATLGIQGLTAPDALSWGLPSVGTNFAYPGTGVSPYITHDDTFQFVEGLSIVKGSHSIKVGGEIRRMRYNEYGNAFSSGIFTFDGGSTCNAASCTSASGYAYADFLLGLPSVATRVVAQANGMMRSTYFAGYIQDDWKVTPKLTLNFGLRYENQRPWVDKYNGQVNAQLFNWGVGFVPGNPNGAYVLPNAAASTPILTRPGNDPFYANINLQYANQPVQNGNQMGPGLVNPNNKNIGPRIGLAYSPFTHWSIRAGYGIFYVQDIGEAEFDLARNRGGKDQNVVANNARTTSLASPWASELASPLCPGYNGPCLIAPQLNVVYQGNTTPYVEQYLFVVQREIKNTVFEAGYLGSEGHHLNRLVLLNQAVLKSGPNDQSSVASRRPWPLLGVIQTDMDTVSSNYNSLEAKVTQRLARGLTYSTAFTWAKSIDSSSGTRGANLYPYNSYNLRQLRGVSDFNEKYRLVGNFVYELPFGPGKNLLSHGVVGALIGGWQVGGILTARTGLPFNGPTLGDTASLGISLGNTGNYTGVSPVPANRSLSHWWNATAFDTTNPNLTYQPGNAGRNALVGIGAITLNGSLSRNIRIHENHQLELRLDAFNALNQANYNTPPTNYLVPSTFGVVTTAATMRQLQLSLRYRF